jgi:hypothetical protein
MPFWRILLLFYANAPSVSNISFLADSYAPRTFAAGPVDLRDQGQINYGADLPAVARECRNSKPLASAHAHTYSRPFAHGLSAYARRYPGRLSDLRRPPLIMLK